MNKCESKIEVVYQPIDGDLWRMASIELFHLPFPWIEARRLEGKGREKIDTMTERRPVKQVLNRLRQRVQLRLIMN
jgi:hypothetical protein